MASSSTSLGFLVRFSHSLVISLLPALSLMLFAAASQADEPRPSSAGPFVKDRDMSAYTLGWADEFEGSSLDSAKWRYRTDSKHWSTQKPENVSVSDGTLKIRVQKEAAEGKSYTGGGVISREAFRYGFYEARLRVPPGAGWHTSFWMMLHDESGGTGPKAACQELDVIENDSINPKSYGVNVHKWKGEHIAFGGKAVATQDLSAEFHVFGCEFTPSAIRYFFDGRLVREVDATHAVRKDGSTQEFEHGDQNIWLTTIASHLGGTKAVDDARLPAMAEFDYVRFWRQSENEEGKQAHIAADEETQRKQRAETSEPIGASR